MASRRHLTAFNRTAKALGVGDDAVCALIVALGRDLARKLDAADDPVVWSKLAPLYMRAGRELKLMADRAIASRKPATETSTESDRNSHEDAPDNVNSLSAFKAQHGMDGNA